MLCFINDEKNDLQLNSLGNIRVEEGIEAYRQILVNVLRLQQFEYLYNLSEGINYLGYVLGDNANLSAWEGQVFEELSKLSFVKSIEDWKYEVEGNVLRFSLSVNTDLGIVEIKG